MKYKINFPITLFITVSSLVVALTNLHQGEMIYAKDPLPSWNNSTSKKVIIDFVTKTTKQGGAAFVPVADRIACFDNDGTLWSEQPMYFQLAFAKDRVNAMAPQHPEWKTTQPFQSLLEGDVETALAGGEKALMQIITNTHSGMTTETFEETVKDWLATAIHPVKKKHYNELVYQPMLALLQYLRQMDTKHLSFLVVELISCVPG